jgi:hypothetical protein
VITVGTVGTSAIVELIIYTIDTQKVGHIRQNIGILYHFNLLFIGYSKSLIDGEIIYNPI